MFYQLRSYNYEGNTVVSEDKYHSIAAEVKSLEFIKPKQIEYFEFKRADYSALNNFFL